MSLVLSLPELSLEAANGALAVLGEYEFGPQLVFTLWTVMFVQYDVVKGRTEGWSTSLLGLVFGVKDSFEVFSITSSSFGLGAMKGIGPPTFFTLLSS